MQKWSYLEDIPENTDQIRDLLNQYSAFGLEEIDPHLNSIVSLANWMEKPSRKPESNTRKHSENNAGKYRAIPSLGDGSFSALQIP